MQWYRAQGADIGGNIVADRAIAIWKQLRLQSNVDLGAVELEGTSTKRRVTLKVTVWPGSP